MSREALPRSEHVPPVLLSLIGVAEDPELLVEEAAVRGRRAAVFRPCRWGGRGHTGRRAWMVPDGVDRGWLVEPASRQPAAFFVITSETRGKSVHGINRTAGTHGPPRERRLQSHDLVHQAARSGGGVGFRTSRPRWYAGSNPGLSVQGEGPADQSHSDNRCRHDAPREWSWREQSLRSSRRPGQRESVSRLLHNERRM